MNVKILITPLIIISFMLLNACGFEVVKMSDRNQFKITELNTSGDRRVNFKIKNSLLVNSAKDNVNQITLDINTEKKKEIKEKNIKNEITKYEINLITNLKINILNKNKVLNESVRVNGDYTVAENFSDTLSNEKKLIDNLVRKLSDQILDLINSRINDF